MGEDGEAYGHYSSDTVVPHASSGAFLFLLCSLVRLSLFVDGTW